MLGTKIYKKDFDAATYSEVADWANDNNAFIDDCGDFYEVKAIPAKSFKELKADKLEELTEIKRSFDNQLINNNMVIGSSVGFNINADLRSQNNIRGLIEAGADKVAFRDANNAIHEVSKEDLQTMLVECISNGASLYNQAWAYEQAIKNAKTSKELEAIELDFRMQGIAI